MSGMITAIAAVSIAAVGVGYSIYSGEQQQKAQAKALDQQKSAQQAAEASALKQEKTAEEATNRSLAKTPSTSAILSSAEQASKTGASGTMLTGTSGVDPNSLQLEKKTLLGG